MSSFGVFLRLLIVVFSFSVVKGLKYSLREHSLPCFICNSESNPSCDDPFDPYNVSIGHCLQHVRGQRKSGGCLKIYVNVQNSTRVIRGCDNSGRGDHEDFCDNYEGPYYRENNCTCRNPLCNAGTNLRPSISFSLVKSLVLFPLIFLFLTY